MKYILIIGMLLSFGCKETAKHNQLERDLLTLSRRTALNDQVYLVTGMNGCGACLEYAISFVKDNIKNKHITFIISERSKVTINVMFGTDITAMPNFIIDSTLNAIKLNVTDGGFPKIFICKDNKLIESFEVPFNEAKEKFDRVKEITSNKSSN